MYSYRAFLLLALVLQFSNLHSQMRKVHIDTSGSFSNEILKVSLTSPSSGYIASTGSPGSWIGYTTDTGRTIIKKHITINNVDFNNNEVNLTFGFSITGVKAFNKDTLLVYGHYGLIPAILYSENAGISFKLVFHSQYNSLALNSTIYSTVYDDDNSTCYAVDRDRILKSYNKGKTWETIYASENSYLEDIQLIGGNKLIALSRSNSCKIIKTVDAGKSWFPLAIPECKNIESISFITDQKGWLALRNSEKEGLVFFTSNGGSTWSLQNKKGTLPFNGGKIAFVNDSVGFSLSSLYTVLKTTDSGKTWEPILRDNEFKYHNNSHSDIQVLGDSFIICGGMRDFIEISTNGGGAPSPKAFFEIDTTNYSEDQLVRLVNYSKKNYTNKWTRNGKDLSNEYNSFYKRNGENGYDTIQLIVNNGVLSDTQTLEIFIPGQPEISSFSPYYRSENEQVVIIGKNLQYVTSVKFGGINALNFTTHSDTMIKVNVGAGSSGKVSIYSPYGWTEKEGFVYVKPVVLDLPTTLSKEIVCKSEPITLTIQNSEKNIKYELVNDVDIKFGSIIGNGGTVSLLSDSINISGDYRLTATRTNSPNTSVYKFSNSIKIKVEQTRSNYTANKVNILPNEVISIKQQSTDADRFLWTFHGDASIAKSTIPNPGNIKYQTEGSKNVTLISISKNGCRDTISGPIVTVYSEQQDSLCYLQVIQDSSVQYEPHHPTIANPTILSIDNGYFISGKGNKPTLSSKIGKSKYLNSDETAYIAKYKSNGVLSWYMYIKAAGNFYSMQQDEGGTLFLTGSCQPYNYLYLPNGDSIRPALTPSDLYLNSETYNGFVMAVDSLGNYLWHSVFDDPSPEYVGYPVKGGIPNKLKLTKNEIIITGTCLSNLIYNYKNQKNTIVSLENSVFENEMQNDFLVKIKKDGSYTWSAYFQNQSSNNIRGIKAIEVNSKNNILIAGLYEGVIKITEGNGNHYRTLNGKENQSGSYLLEMDFNGNIKWLKEFNNSCQINDITVDHLDNIYIAGSKAIFQGSFEIISNNITEQVITGSFFLLKMDNTGKFLWCQGSTTGYYGAGISIASTYSDLYVLGNVSENSGSSSWYTFTSSDGNFQRHRINSSEFFIAQYSRNGELKKIIKSNELEPSTTDPKNIIIDKEKKLIIAATAIAFGKYSGFSLYENLNGKECVFFKINTGSCFPLSPLIISAGKDKSICIGDSIDIGETDKEDLGYYWRSSEDSFTSISPKPKVSPKKTTTNNLGQVAKDTVTVYVKQPYLGSQSLEEKVICMGEKIKIGDTSFAKSSYSWSSIPIGFYSNSPNPEVAPIISTSYIAKIKDSTGCSVTDTIRIIVDSLKKPSVIISASSIDICKNDTITFIATSTDEGANPSYKWMLNDSPQNNKTPIYKSSAFSDNDKIYVVMSSSQKCITSEKDSSNVITINVSEILKPSLVITSNQTSICEKDSIIFSAVAQQAGSDPKFQWYINGNAQFFGTRFFSTSLSASSNIHATVLSSLKCGHPQIESSNIIEVNVSKKIKPIFTIKGKTIINEGESFQISSADTEGIINPIYQWQDSTMENGWQDIPDSTSKTIHYTPKRTLSKIRCILNSKDPCVEAKNLLSNSLLLIVLPSTNQPKEEIFLFPNPASSDLKIKFSSSPNNWQSLSIYDSNGKRVVEKMIFDNPSLINISIQSLTPGIYFVSLQNREGSSRHLKFIKK